MKVVFKKTAEKQLLKLPTHLFVSIKDKCRQLASPPINFNIKKLSGRNEFRLRVGDYRVIYLVNHKSQEIIILSVVNRKDAYR